MKDEMPWFEVTIQVSLEAPSLEHADEMIVTMIDEMCCSMPESLAWSIFPSKVVEASDDR